MSMTSPRSPPPAPGSTHRAGGDGTDADRGGVQRSIHGELSGRHDRAHASFALSGDSHPATFTYRRRIASFYGPLDLSASSTGANASIPATVGTFSQTCTWLKPASAKRRNAAANSPG